MSLYDIRILAADGQTDTDRANRIKIYLYKCGKQMRQAVKRTKLLVDNAPGGKAALVAELGADAQLVVNILTTFDGCANASALKAPGDITVTAGLVQGDLP